MDAEIAAMFPAAMEMQRRRFFRALTRVIRRDDNLAPYLERLGAAHRKDGVRERHFDVFRRALMATLQRYAADVWDEAAQAAWGAAFDNAATAMLAAAKRDGENAPAWWICTVTRTERRTSDIAVLTLQPDQPLSFLPGQHVSVQTLHWPRMWRTYSIANAPRLDGTLTLHVRATSGGLVSNALVHHVSAGDPLIVGAPAGDMIADTGSTRDVLCLAGGTGLAPVKAIIEAITAAPAGGKRREIALYLGVRRHHDFYDLPDLREMEVAYPWLQVIPAVSDEPAKDTMPGTVPERAAKASWPGRDIYISGPDEMIVKTVRLLRELGASGHRLHYDVTDEAAQTLL